MKSENKGITLVALILTIIVLIILAVISINAVNDNGIIGKAKEARFKQEKESKIEQNEIIRQVDIIEQSLKNESKIIWYTEFTQTETNSFIASARGWALSEVDYANIYEKPINKLSFVSTNDSGTIDIAIATIKNVNEFSNKQIINWDSSNKIGNIVIIDIDEIILTKGELLCLFTQNAPLSGAACYANGSTAGRFYSYVGNRASWSNPSNSYSIQINVGYMS